jgi:hypothetical protein
MFHKTKKEMFVLPDVDKWMAHEKARLWGGLS